MARPFKDARYPGVSSRLKNGKLIYRYRAKGMPEIRLPGKPGDPEFEAAYEKATQGQGKKAVIVDLPGRALPKTFGHAARRLETTMEWLGFDEGTQQKNARLIERFLNLPVDPNYPLTWRNTPVEHLDADRLRAIIEGIFRTNRTVAKHTLVAIKKLLWVATDVEKWIKPQDDPSLSIRVRVPKSTKNPAWPIAMREKFEERHPIGTAARTCYALGFWLGNRRGDIAALEWDDLLTEEIELFDGSLVLIEAFDFRQKKNRNRHGGREMFIPVVDKLATALDLLDRSRGGTVLKNAYGRSFSEKSLTGMMQHWTRQAGIPSGYTLHGLRRTFGTYLAECNIQARAIMEAMGHSSMTVTDEYVREANKKRIAVDIARAINEREAKRDAMKRRANLRIVR
ncbi:site-specific integrase [Mesorhizobium sp.]|uniref:tyrosine-type recombinase/integrase n=1 Tax=Mesorhizobium sp. TaxID=1871066 RepID=UPI000FEA82E9|nr:site-specific integrase [Mesorhizobium sp.]RWA60566.1 MAG: site-specific integrase [Mesorhizobium sp.]RWA76230.1 MAG: site-specific integrase [Mesorhizobium sp.]RWP36339.1 MAG: site-specific integrase [Mesorhizobium sp.]TIS65386.1 MAG: site-specific integrase [Mesorhizobium sp.]